MENTLYKKNIIQHYKSPKNYGKLKDYDRSFLLANTTCGDEIEVYIKFDGTKISKISFQGQGCAISLASMSMLGEKVKGKEIAFVKGIKDVDVLNMLGMKKNTPRVNCALLGFEVLKRILDN